MAPGERPEQAKGSPAAGAEGEAAEARERLFAAALLGHSADACGETLCNFRVTHLPSGHSWYLRRGLQEWLELQESIHWEIEAGVHKKGEGKGPKAAERPGDVHPGLLRVARSACASVLGGGLGRSSGSRAPRMSGAMIGGAVAADVQRRQRQTEALQAQLSQMLSDPRLRHSGALQRFLGIQLPEVPSLVRVARLQPDPMVWRPEDGDAALIEGTVEVTIRDVLDEASPDSGEAPALATHVVATVAAVVESDRSVDMCSDVDLIPVTEIEMPVVVPMQIVVGGLRPLSAYEFEVCAANAVGRSGSVRIRVLVPSASMLAGAAPSRGGGDPEAAGQPKSAFGGAPAVAQQGATEATGAPPPLAADLAPPAPAAARPEATPDADAPAPAEPPAGALAATGNRAEPPAGGEAEPPAGAFAAEGSPEVAAPAEPPAGAPPAGKSPEEAAPADPEGGAGAAAQPGPQVGALAAEGVSEVAAPVRRAKGPGVGAAGRGGSPSQRSPSAAAGGGGAVGQAPHAAAADSLARRVAEDAPPDQLCSSAAAADLGPQASAPAACQAVEEREEEGAAAILQGAVDMVPRAAAADLSPAAREAEAAPPDQPASPVMTDSLEPRTAATVEEEQPAAAFQGIVDRASPAGEPADLVPAALEVAEAAESGRLASLAAAGELELEVAEVAESERLASLAAAGDLEPEASLASACGPQPTAKEEREADAAESAAGQALPVASAGQDAPPNPPTDLGIRAPPVTAAAPQPAAVEEEAVTADLHDAVDVASPAAAAGPSLADREVAEAGRPACPAMAADLGPRACPATPAAVQQAAEEEERAASAFEDLVDQEALAAVAADPSPAVREVAEAAPPDRPASPDMDHDFGPRTSPAAAAVQLTAAEDGAPTAAFERVVDEALPAAVADPLAGVQKIAQAVPKDQPINLVPQTSQAAAIAAKSAAEEDEEKEEASVAADLQAAVEQISPAIVAAEPLPAAKEVAEASPPDRPHSMAVAAAQLPLEEELGAAADLQGVAEQISPALVAAEPMPAVEEVAEAAPPDRPPSLAAASDPEPGPPLETAMAVQFAPEDEEGAAAELLGAVAPAATAADVPPAAPELAKAASPERPASPALAADLQLRAAAAAPPAAEEVAAAASGPDQPSVAPAAAARVAAAPAAPAPTPAAPSPPAVARGPPRPGCRRVVGFELIVERMPPEAKILDVEALVEELLALRAGPAARLTPQQALRLLLGCNLSVREAAERADLVQAWRLEHDLAGVRRSLAGCLGGLGVGAGAVPPSACLPGHEQVCQLMVVNPCVLTTVDGRPVSIWHIGSARSSAVGSTPDDMLAAWSRATFEYVDLWLSAQSETSGCLAGHVQVFDLSGLGFRLVSNSALQEKLKVALGAGGFYVEVVSHIFVINSGTLFTMAWKVIENFITPRTASKIVVNGGVPGALAELLDAPSRERLPGLLKRPRSDAPLLLPPCPVDGH